MGQENERLPLGYCKESVDRERVYPTAKPDDFKINERWLHLMPKIGGEDAEGMIESIKRTGVLKPIEVLPDMTIIDGYQRHRTVKNNPDAPQDIPYEIKSDFGNKIPGRDRGLHCYR